MKNEDIRKAAAENHVCQWEIAERLGISEFTFSRWMRRELPEGTKKKIRQAIREISGERKEK